MSSSRAARVTRLRNQAGTSGSVNSSGLIRWGRFGSPSIISLICPGISGSSIPAASMVSRTCWMTSSVVGRGRLARGAPDVVPAWLLPCLGIILRASGPKWNDWQGTEGSGWFALTGAVPTCTDCEVEVVADWGCCWLLELDIGVDDGGEAAEVCGDITGPGPPDIIAMMSSTTILVFGPAACWLVVEFVVPVLAELVWLVKSGAKMFLGSVLAVVALLVVGPVWPVVDAGGVDAMALLMVDMRLVNAMPPWGLTLRVIAGRLGWPDVCCSGGPFAGPLWEPDAIGCWEIGIKKNCSTVCQNWYKLGIALSLQR